MRYIVFVISSLTSGGAEKVMAELANQASKTNHVTLIILSKKERFYQISSRVVVIEPNFTIAEMPRLFFKWRNFWWLRKTLKNLSASSVLTFSGKYNAFVLLSSLGLGKKVFISDRSRPGISYGKFLDVLNPIVYRLSAGIIAQTSQAEQFVYKQTKHKNIQVIPNPIELPKRLDVQTRENLIINVGRFIESKHQDWMVDYFSEMNPNSWSLSFLGEGKLLERVQNYAKQKSDSIYFEGNVRNMSLWYSRASIFAFTSTSEGFPNSLAEAMAHGCACISFDCVAGPADIIDDGINGFLIPEGNHELFKAKLKELVINKKLRESFGRAAVKKMKKYDSKHISKSYLDFILK